MVMPSVGRRNSSSFASAADFATLASADRLERLGDRRHRPAGALPARPSAASSISLQPPQAGHDADAGLDQAHVGLGMGLDGGAVQQDLAAAAERHARRRADDREGRVFQRAGRPAGPWRPAPRSSATGATLAANRARPRLAPTEKFVALVVDHQRLDAVRPRARSTLPSSSSVSASSAFILRVNSKQATPSPMSQSAAEPFAQQACRGPLDVGEQQHAVGPWHRQVAAVDAELLAAGRPGPGRRARPAPAAAAPAPAGPRRPAGRRTSRRRAGRSARTARTSSCSRAASPDRRRRWCRRSPAPARRRRPASRSAPRQA